MKRIEMFVLPNGHEPFADWIDSLDTPVRARIYAYIERVAAGGAVKNVKPVGFGVSEIKVDVGPGYRVYFGELRGQIILLLWGGDKSTQKKDIKTAITYWRQYVSK